MSWNMDIVGSKTENLVVHFPLWRNFSGLEFQTSGKQYRDTKLLE